MICRFLVSLQATKFGRGTPMNFDHSPRAKEYLKKIKTFMKEHIIPAEAEYYAHLEQDGQKWTVPPIMEALKAEAKRQGLWNLFLPDEEYGVGLSNVEYAPLAEAMGHSFIAPEVFNCNAPDTGNMEVLIKYGSEEQHERWLAPLRAGKNRSACDMHA